MSFDILPQEMHLLNDNPTIRTRVPYTEITDAMMIKRVRHANLSAGDHILVQCMNHSYETMLAETVYVVTMRQSHFVVREIDDRGNKQGEEFDTAVAQKGEWWVLEQAGKEQAPDEPQESIVNGEVKWNPRKQVHEVLINGEAVYGTKDKETALKVADGSMAIPLEEEAA